MMQIPKNTQEAILISHQINIPMVPHSNNFGFN
jgi:hypothetical protein